MVEKQKTINALTYFFLFVCIFTSKHWGYQILSAGGEVFRFDKILLFGQLNVYYLFAGLFFLIVFFEKFSPNNDRNILGDRNYLKYIFLMYFIPVNVLLYITIYVKGITLYSLGSGVAPILMFFVYLVTTFYIQDVLLKNKNYKQLVGIITVLEVFILVRCFYSIVKYFLGFGYHDELLGGRIRLGYENDFADFFILLFIIALTRLLFEKNESRKVRMLHKLGVILSAYVAIFSFRRYFWLELLVAGSIILFFHHRFNKVHINKKVIFTCLIVVFVLGSLLIAGKDRIINNRFVGRFISVFSIIDEGKFTTQYGTNTGHVGELEDGWYNVKRNWLLGVTPLGGEKVKRLEAKWQEGGTYVHCAFLYIWLNYGLLGLALFLALYWKSIRLGLELFINKGLPFGLMLFTFLCAQTIKNIIWNTIIINMNVTIIYIFIISIAIKMKQNTERK